MLASMPMPPGASMSWSWPMTGIMLVKGQPHTLKMMVMVSAPTMRFSRPAMTMPWPILARIDPSAGARMPARWRMPSAMTNAAA